MGAKFGCLQYCEHPNLHFGKFSTFRIWNFHSEKDDFTTFQKEIKESILSTIFVTLGSTLDLTANAVSVGKHVERCDEARKYLVAKHN